MSDHPLPLGACPIPGCSSFGGSLHDAPAHERWAMTGAPLSVNTPVVAAVSSTILSPRCGHPGPLVLNGGGYAGCDLPFDHEGDQHSFTVKWARG
jgi:hypothetical protein